MEKPGENLISDKVLGRDHSPSGCSDSWRCRRARLACRRGRRRCGTRSRCRSWAGLGGSLEGRGRGARSRAPSRPPNPGPGCWGQCWFLTSFTWENPDGGFFYPIARGKAGKAEDPKQGLLHLRTTHWSNKSWQYLISLMSVLISIFSNLFSACHDSR